MVYVTEVPERAITTLIVNATYGTQVQLTRIRPGDISEELCSMTVTFRESGDYWLFLDYGQEAGQQVSCALLLANDPSPAEMR